MGLPYITLFRLALGCAFVMGAAMAVWGLRGRRVGDEPHCRRCGYDLTGGPERCPECGTEALGKNIVVGARQRRWRAAGAGSALVLVSAAALGSVLYGRAKGTNWYPHLPESALVLLAEGDDASAIEELVARYNNGEVKGEALVGLVPRALDRQGVKPIPRSFRAWTKLLTTIDIAGRLSREQSEQFRDQLLVISWEFRPRVRVGEELFVSVKGWGMGSPRMIGKCSITDASIRVGDRNREFYGFGPLSVSGPRVGKTGTYMPTGEFAPGKYKVELRATKAFEEPSFTRPFLATGELEILPSDAPDTLRLVNNPALTTAFRKAISITVVPPSLGGQAGRGMNSIEVSLREIVPMNAVFDVSVRIRNEERRLTTIAFKRGDSLGLRCGSSHSWLTRGDCFVPILRTNAAHARKSPDIFEIWNGELVFDPVCVETSAEASLSPEDVDTSDVNDP